MHTKLWMELGERMNDIHHVLTYIYLRCVDQGKNLDILMVNGDIYDWGTKNECLMVKRLNWIILYN